MIRRVILVLLFGALIQTTQAGTPLPITKLQSRRLPEPVVTQRILDQLSAVLSQQRFDMTDRPSPQLPLSDVWYWLKPYSTGYEGLCEIDEVIFRFHPVGPLRRAETETRVRSIEIQRGYYLKMPPAQFTPPEINEASVPQADADCEKTDASKAQTISADSAEIAWKGSWLASEVIRQSGQIKPAFAINCTGSDCTPSVSDLDAKYMSFARNCTKPEPANECMEVYTRGPNSDLLWSLRIVYALHGEAATVVSVTRDELVVTADMRAD